MSGIDFSVIVPTYNRPDSLRECLRALTSQDYPRDRFEVIVVDDGGESSPAPVVDALRSQLPVRLITQSHGGPARARNFAARAARGKFLAFTDDDCRPHPSWLARLAVALERARDCIVGGRVVNGLPDNPFSSTSQMIADIVYAHYNADPQNARFFSSNNIAMAADSYRSIGGFDEGFVILACEDRELCDRWRAQGRRMIYERDAVVEHAHVLGLFGFLRQHFTYGRGALHFHRIRAARASGRMRQEMSFHLHVRNWLAHPFRRRRPAEAARIAALMVVWQGANLAGFAYEMLARNGYRPSGSKK